MESKVRAARDDTEIVHLIADELRKLVGARQVIVLQAKAPDTFRVACVSSLVLTEKDTPFIRWVEAMVRQIRTEHLDEAVSFALPAFTDPDAPESRSYPFSHIIWQPLRLVAGTAFAGLLVARERPWTEQDRRVVAREADVFAGMWQALHGGTALMPKKAGWQRRRLMLLVLAVAAALCPVPMTTLAPVEIVAREPQRVAAPLDGVIKDILVPPNRAVERGQLILTFDDTTLRNKLDLAEQDLLLSAARVDRAMQAAFSEEAARHELAQARAEHDLKKAERNYAAELMARTRVHAERGGVLVYADKDRWIGRPVRTGERIMQIVQPSEIAARIELPVADAIVLEKGARVRLFLDAAPLTAVDAKLVAEGYQAEPNSTQQLVYQLRAEIPPGGPRLRIGARGTAQLVGGWVPLAFYLLRRPISAARQNLGL
jgi:multidrug efflux pump subunit AcrA (membrane-fusion protein)